MKADDELEVWRRHWQAQPSVPMDLFRKVEKETEHMRGYRLLEVLATVFIGGGTLALALITRNVNWILLASGTWVFIVMAWLFSIRQTRGIWAPSAPTTAAYLELSIRRCEWKIADANYDIVQSILIAAFVLIIDYHVLADMKGQPPSVWLLAALFVAIAVPIIVGFQWKKRKVREERSNLMNLQRELNAG